MPLNLTAEQRVGRRIKRVGDCLVWTGCKDPAGYGHITYETVAQGAHRFVWELQKGPVPKGMCLDHLCRNRACVNIEHMEVVTMRENVLRGIGITARNAKITHCVNGHEFTNENTYRAKDGSRHCKLCIRLRTLKYKTAKRGQSYG